MADRELPVMTDEQIDAIWKAAWAAPAASRGQPSWERLRAAFPAPRPPRPRGNWFSVTEAGYITSAGAINAEDAPDALVELQACVDWITEEAQR